jgi:Delta carbonic anhydrase
MTKFFIRWLAASTTLFSTAVLADTTCQNFGPQAPRDISRTTGTNKSAFAKAPSPALMNLCNIHFHSSAEHKGPGYQLISKKSSTHAAATHAPQAHSAGHAEGGAGYICNDSNKLTASEKTTPSGNVCAGLAAGDTIEIHWVYTSCDVSLSPGKGLGACLSKTCENPTLRVESQVFLVVNDSRALDFKNFDIVASKARDRLQPESLPTRTGTPVTFRGSTTGSDFNEQTCSPKQVTWSVRPQCAKVDINSMQQWCASNAFGETGGHGVRPLVTTAALLDGMQQSSEASGNQTARRVLRHCGGERRYRDPVSGRCVEK